MEETDEDVDCEIVKVEEADVADAEQCADQDGDETGEKPASCEGVTGKAIEMFEMLDITDRTEPKVSQTATPNNTPLGKHSLCDSSLTGPFVDKFRGHWHAV